VLIKSTDYGNTWTPLTISVPTMNFNSVYLVSNNVAYAVGDYGAIVKTVDGGATWQLQSAATSFDLNSVYCLSANDCYAAGDKGLILKTTTGGNRLAISDDASTSEGGFIFYPNPASDILSFIFEGAANHTIVISNTLGQTIIQERTLQKEFTLKITHLPKGVYIISLFIPKKKIFP